MSRQLQSISFKSVAIGKSGIGKSEFLLTDLSTAPTFKPLNPIIQEDPLRSDRNHPESPGKCATKNNIPAPTLRASKLSSFSPGGKENGPFLVSTVDIVVANQTKTVVQETRGHASPFVTGNPQQISFWGVCPFFSTTKSTHQPDEPKRTYLLPSLHPEFPDDCNDDTLQLLNINEL